LQRKRKRERESIMSIAEEEKERERESIMSIAIMSTAHYCILLYIPLGMFVLDILAIRYSCNMVGL